MFSPRELALYVAPRLLPRLQSLACSLMADTGSDIVKLANAMRTLPAGSKRVLLAYQNVGPADTYWSRKIIPALIEFVTDCNVHYMELKVMAARAFPPLELSCKHGDFGRAISTALRCLIMSQVKLGNKDVAALCALLSNPATQLHTVFLRCATVTSCFVFFVFFGLRERPAGPSRRVKSPCDQHNEKGLPSTRVIKHPSLMVVPTPSHLTWLCVRTGTW
jgi:hypothetical protein